MKNLKQLLISLSLVSASLLTSCLGSQENDMTTSDKLTGFFNVIYDSDGNQTFKDGVSYDVDWKYGSEQTAKLRINGLQLPQGQKYNVVAFDDVPWKINNKGWQDISLTQATPSNLTSTGLIFDRLDFQMLNRIYGNIQFPACTVISYTLNGADYRIVSLPQQMVEVGKTVVRDPSGKEFVQETEQSPFYYFILNPDSKSAFLVIQGAKFAEQMPAMNMKFPGLKFEVDEYANIMIHGTDITPTLMGDTNDINAAGTPFEGATITNFISEYRPGSGVDMTFTCTIATKNQPVAVAYDVMFSTKFPSTAK